MGSWRQYSKPASSQNRHPAPFPKKSRTPPKSSSRSLPQNVPHPSKTVIPQPYPKRHPPPPQRHPAFNAGSVLYERNNREAFNAIFE